MQPPLPQLSGAASAPSDVKWARRALVLSVAGVAALLALPIVFVFLFFKGGRDSDSIPLFGRDVLSIYLIAPFILGSIFFSLAGLIIGFRNKKASNAKAARVLGGITAAFWLTVTTVACVADYNATHSRAERHDK